MTKTAPNTTPKTALLTVQASTSTNPSRSRRAILRQIEGLDDALMW